MSENNIDISIIVPALNEERNILESLKAIITSCESLNLNYQIIVVDDHSTDQTYSLVSNEYYQNKSIEIYKNPNAKGLGSAYEFGLGKSNGIYTTWVPGDNQHPVNGLIQVYSHIYKYDF
jgi:glycosyltransferase involved in cell wall biosynthesis